MKIRATDKLAATQNIPITRTTMTNDSLNSIIIDDYGSFDEDSVEEETETTDFIDEETEITTPFTTTLTLAVTNQTSLTGERNNEEQDE